MTSTRQIGTVLVQLAAILVIQQICLGLLSLVFARAIGP